MAEEKKNLSTEKTQDLNTLNSPLSVNAECAFERKFRVNNYLDLTGAETVQSAADVAFIFKNLRDEAVENAFAVFVKDKKPTVVHLSIGNSNTAFVPPNIISLAAKKIQPDEMYFVHNHPGGNVEPSEYDLETLEAIKKIVRMNPENEKLPVHNIIVNGFSNTYSYIEDKKEFEIEKGRIEDKEFAGNIPIYSVDKRVFNKDFECPQKISSPADVAEYIYSHRLGERKNLNALLLDGTACVGNLCLPYSEIKGNENKIASDLVTASAQFSANRIIMFGNDYDLFDQVLQLKNTLRESGMGYLLSDAIVADGKSSYSSALEHGLLKVSEPEEKYEAKEKNNMNDEMKKYTEPNNLAIIVNEKEISDFVTEGNFVNPNKMMAIQLLGYEETKKIWDLGLDSGNEFGIAFQRGFELSSGVLATHEEIEQANKLKDSLYKKYQSRETLEESEIDSNKTKIFIDYENKKITQMYYNGDAPEGGYFVRLENSFEQLDDVLDDVLEGKDIEYFDINLEGLANGYPIHRKNEYPEEYARDLDEWNNKPADIEFDFTDTAAKQKAAIELTGKIAEEFAGRNFGEVDFFDSIREAINGDARKLESLELEEHFGRIHRIHTNVASLHDLDKVTDMTFDNMEWLGDEFRYTIYPDDETFESFVGETIEEFCENNNISSDFMANRIEVSMTDGNVEAYYLIDAEGQNVFEKNVTEELFFEGSSAYTPAMLKEFRKEVLPELQNKQTELVSQFNAFFGTTFENAKEVVFTSSYGDPSENVTLEDALIDIAQDKLLDDWRKNSGIKLADEPEDVYGIAHEFARNIITGLNDVSNLTYERVLSQFEEQAQQELDVQENLNEKENTMSDEMKTLQDLQSQINEQKSKQAELHDKEESLKLSQEELWQKSFDAFRKKVLELKEYIPDSGNIEINREPGGSILEKENRTWSDNFNLLPLPYYAGAMCLVKSNESVFLCYNGTSKIWPYENLTTNEIISKHASQVYKARENFPKFCHEQNLAEKITGIVTEYAQKNLESLAKQNEEKSATLEQKQAYLSKYTAPASNEPMQSVQSLEQFFDREFSSAELVRAIEEMGFYSDEIKPAYHLENDPNAERTYVFGTLAANAIIDIHEEKGMKLNDEAAEEIYKIGIEVAQNKFGSYNELEPKLEKIFGNEKNIRPYSKDMRNLEKVLDTWEKGRVETAEGTRMDLGSHSPESVWIDNWRMSSTFYDNNWQISYKGTPVIECNEGIVDYIADKKILENAKLNIGDVLQTVCEKVSSAVDCPQLDDVYKPSQNYCIDKMNFKEREFYKNPPYPGFAAQMERVKQIAKNHFENGSNEMLKDYRLALVLPKSRHPDDKELSCVMAKNEKTQNYAVWTSFNTDTKGYENTDYGAQGSLNHGHYNIKNLNDAAKIMCAVSDSRPLHIEHRQQIKRGNDVER